MRKDQLDLALYMEEWTDAHKISGNIYQLMLKVRNKRTETQTREIFSEFFNHLSSIFWESELYLFHTYALQNVQHLLRSFKTSTEKDKININNKFVLAALSIPPNNRLSNFERLSFNYLPDSLKHFDQANLMGREELNATAKMLQVEG
jgi:hypothetical protein